jgi:hypothetical protein
MAILNTLISTTDPTTVFTATAETAVTVMYLCNHSGGDATVNVYCISDDGSTGASTDNIIYSQLEITTNDTYVISTEKMVLDENDYLMVEANVANVITVTVSTMSI